MTALLRAHFFNFVVISADFGCFGDFLNISFIWNRFNFRTTDSSKTHRARTFLTLWTCENASTLVSGRLWVRTDAKMWSFPSNRPKCDHSLVTDQIAGNLPHPIKIGREHQDVLEVKSRDHFFRTQWLPKTFPSVWEVLNSVYRTLGEEVRAYEREDQKVSILSLKQPQITTKLKKWALKNKRGKNIMYFIHPHSSEFRCRRP